MKESLTGRIFTIANYAFFTILGIAMLYPMWYVIMFSFSDPTINHLNNLSFSRYRTTLTWTHTNMYLTSS